MNELTLTRSSPRLAGPVCAGGHAGWPDARLVAVVRDDPSDLPALDALVRRHWPLLHARCRLLTLDREQASDLAQETWLRVLRARAALQPEGSFPAYLVTIATNLWRDRHRTARRAGALAEHRLASIDATVPTGEGEGVAIGEAIPDPTTLLPDEQALLRLDLDRALARLTPRARDVLLARYLDGESAAEIGRRYGRTEQTITSWLRQALRDVRAHLDASLGGTAGRAGTR